MQGTGLDIPLSFIFFQWNRAEILLVFPDNTLPGRTS